MNKIEKEWLKMPANEIFKNISLLINDIDELDEFEDYAGAERLMNLLLSLPTEKLIATMISLLNSDSDNFPYENCITFPNAWFSLALNQESRKELITQLSAVDFSEYIFTFLNGIDEGNKTPGEIAIRGVLNDIGYPIPRDTSLDWSPDGKYKRVTLRKIVELKADPVTNFSGLIDAILYYDSTYWDYFLQSVTNTINKIPPDILTLFMINDLVNRGGVSGSLFEYACCWYRLASTPEGADELEKQLLILPKDSCVISYLNEMYRVQAADDPDESDANLKSLLERANVFIDQTSIAQNNH